MKALALNFNIFEIQKRDVTFFTIAFMVHCLLFLWQAGTLKIIDEKKNELGEAIVQVQFITEVPAEVMAGRGEPKKKRGLFAKVKSFFSSPQQRSKTKIEPMSEATKSPKIDASKPIWKKTNGGDLKNKKYQEKMGFSQQDKEIALDVTKGKSQKVQVAQAKGDFRSTSPQLKSKSYRISHNETPFSIKKPSKDIELSNVNAIPVSVGKKSNSNVDVFKGSAGGGTLTSKKFSDGSSDGAFGGLSGASKPGGSARIDAGLATGSGRSSGASASTTGRGRTYSGRPGVSIGTPMASLPRNVVGAGGGDGGEAVSGGRGSKQPFSIQGLEGRQIFEKVIPKITQDIRAAFRFRVDWKGRVLHGIEVVISSGFPSLDNKLLDALLKWVFSPLPQKRANEIQEGIITFRFKGK
jgi:TonB family protein